MVRQFLSRTIGAASRALLRNRMRTLLTTIGISIGIAAVMCTVALGAGSAARLEAQLDNIGDDFLWIEPGSVAVAGARSGWGGARTLVDADAFAIADQVPEVALCTPQFDGRVQAIAAGRNWNTRYLGVSPDLFEIRRWRLAAGTFFADYDVRERTPVVVLGPGVAAMLFDSENPVGRTVRLDRVDFQVLGVLESKGVSGAGVDRDDVVYLPYTTARRHFYDREWIDDIYCSVHDPKQMLQAEAGVMSLLRMRHELAPDEPDDFSIRKPETTLQLRAQSSQTLAVMLTAIAAVSLVVGGVGVMNIMLVSVTERTREIGLRLAIGARVADIRAQFMAEAVLLGLAGGVIGVSLGWVAAEVLTGRLGWPAVVSADAITAAVATAAGTGLLFGYYPAHRASALDPIDALRAES